MLQALRVRAQLFDLMVSKGLGVDQALYSNSDPAAKLFVDLAKDSGYATGYMLKPTVAIVESIGYIGWGHLAVMVALDLHLHWVQPAQRRTWVVMHRPYYRNKTLYPSVVYPQIGDPDVDSRVYSFFVRSLHLSCLQGTSPASGKRPEARHGVLAVQEGGYSLVTIKPVNLPYLGRIDLGAPRHAAATELQDAECLSMGIQGRESTCAMQGPPSSTPSFAL
jgi:hypothetical protein